MAYNRFDSWPKKYIYIGKILHSPRTIFCMTWYVIKPIFPHKKTVKILYIAISPKFSYIVPGQTVLDSLRDENFTLVLQFDYAGVCVSVQSIYLSFIGCDEHSITKNTLPPLFSKNNCNSSFRDYCSSVMFLPLSYIFSHTQATPKPCQIIFDCKRH